ncbi:MAG: peptide-binding protein [Candidatus Omnitrophica bacterium]|nr:peptide-binding protein [Candidatus Omnitrophota bacterium]
MVSLSNHERSDARSPFDRLRVNGNVTRFSSFVLALLLSASFIIPFLIGLAAAEEIDIPVIGDALVSASIGEPSTLIPILASDSASAEVSGLLFNGLVKYDPDLSLVGDLAERWEIRDGGLEILFFLRKGVRWHDGVPFTASDVQFTYQRLIDPSVPTPYRGDFERIASLEVVDDTTVRVRYKEPFAPALSSWGMGILPKHLLENQNLTNTPFKERPVGTGPFIFHRWIRGDRIELKANPDYFEGRPYLNWAVIRIIPDQATIFLELQARGIDMTGLTPLQFTRMTQIPRFTEAFQKFCYPSFGYTYLGYNLRDPKFQDKRVRQALNLAINKQEILQGVLYGLGAEATGPFPQESWAYDPGVHPAPYDPGQAKALLAEAGWRDTDGDGILDRDGRPFEFTILTNQGNLARELTAQIIQQQLSRVGIRVKIRILEWAALLHQFIDKHRFEAILLGWGLSRDPDPFDIWHSSKTGEGEFNFIGYSNPEVDRLLLEGRANFDQEKRRAIYWKLHRILYEEQPVCFLYVSDSLPVVHRRFQQVEVSPLGLGYNLIHWYVPVSRQRYQLS